MKLKLDRSKNKNSRTTRRVGNDYLFFRENGVMWVRTECMLLRDHGTSVVESSLDGAAVQDPGFKSSFRFEPL